MTPPVGRRSLPAAVPFAAAVERGRDRVAQRRVQPEARAAVEDAAGERGAEAGVEGAWALGGEERGGRPNHADSHAVALGVLELHSDLEHVCGEVEKEERRRSERG